MKVIGYGFAICIVFLLLKMLEMKFSKSDDKKPLKQIFRESLFVFLSSVLGIYLYSQFDESSITSKSPGAFINNPDF
jgi:O-antigen/teichoic acid export membrane protein